MKKVLFLLLSLLPFLAHAAPGPMPMPSTPEGGMFGAPPGGIDGDDVLVMAYDVRRALMSRQELNGDLIAEIEAIIRDSMEQEDQRVLKGYLFLLRRYNKVAHICQRAKFDQLAYLQARADLERRTRLVKEMITLYTKLRTAENLIHNLDSNLSEQQRTDYYNQFKALYDKHATRIEQIHEELSTLEQTLLKDPRTFSEKYGGLIVGSLATFSAIALCTAIGNIIGIWLRKRQRNAQGDAAEAYAG